MNITLKIKRAGLIGRGGACFPTDIKWQAVKKARNNEKYIVCNISEGEPGVKKDFYLLKNYLNETIGGIKIAFDYLQSPKTKVKGYLYINPSYFPKLKKSLEAEIRKAGLTDKLFLFKKPHEAGYAGGEESSALNALEGERAEPRLKPPYPTTEGLWGKPTLINNPETFRDVFLVANNKYENKRLITIGGDASKKGVFETDKNKTIEDVLSETGNYPKKDFFVQVGGDGSGAVFNKNQLKQPVIGAGSITIYEAKKHKIDDLLDFWLNFFKKESCGQCTPCREGTFRLTEAIKEKNPDWELIEEILDTLDDTAFCGLGCAVSIPVRTYVQNVLKEGDEKFKNDKVKMICECFD